MFMNTLYSKAGASILAVGNNPGISPNSNGLPGVNEAKNLVGALLLYATIACVAGVIINAARMAFANHHGNPQQAGSSRTGALYCFAAALLIGGADFLVAFFVTAGQAIN